MANEKILKNIWVADCVDRTTLRIDFYNDSHYALEFKHKKTTDKDIVFRLKELIHAIEKGYENGE